MSGSKNCVHSHNRIPCSRQKEGAYTLCDIMDGIGEHYAKQNKPGSDKQIPYGLTFNKNLINKTNKQNITKDTEIENRLTVTRGEREEDYMGKG